MKPLSRRSQFLGRVYTSLLVLVAVSACAAERMGASETDITAEATQDSGAIGTQALAGSGELPSTPEYIPLPANVPSPPFTEAATSTLNYDGPVPEGAFARLGRGNICCADLSQAGDYLVIGNAIGVYLYEVDTFREVWFRATPDWAADVALSQDGSLAASGLRDGTIMLWDAASGEVLQTLEEHTSFLEDISFSPDGALLASVDDDSVVIIWDTATGESLHILQEGEYHRSTLTWLPEGHTLAIRDTDGVTLLDVESLESRHISLSEDGRDRSQDVAFNQDGTMMAVLLERTVLLIETATGDPLRAMESPTSVFSGSIAINPDGTMLAAGTDDGGIIIWDIDTGERLHTLQGHIHDVIDLAFSPDGASLFSSALDGRIIEWDVQSGEPMRALGGHTSSMRYVSGVTWSPDGSTLAYTFSGLPDLEYPDGWTHFDTVMMWHTESGALRALPTQEWHFSVEDPAFSPNGDVLVTGSSENLIVVWDSISGEPERELGGVSQGLAFSPDGSLLASGGFGSIILWDFETGSQLWQRVATFPSFTSSASTLTFSPDGRSLLVGGQGAVMALDVGSGEPLFTLTGHSGEVNDIAFSPDGSMLASGGSEGTIIIWAADTHDQRLVLNGPSASPIEGLAWSPDGHTLASGADVVTLWNADTGEQIDSFRGDAMGAVTSLAWSPDGNILAAGGGDGTVVLWNVGQLGQ